MQKPVDAQVTKIMKFNRKFQPNFSKIDRCQQNSRLYFVFAAPGMVQKKQTLLFFRLVVFHLCIFSSSDFPHRFFLFMHFSSYPFRRFRLIVLLFLISFRVFVPFCEYPQTRLASARSTQGGFGCSRLGARARLEARDSGLAHH